MKFIKYAVGLVIALSVIPLVVVSVNNLEQTRLRTVEFEVVDWDSGTNTITFSENTYNDIHTLVIYNDDNDVSNLITVKLNDVELGDFLLYTNTTRDLYDFSDDNSNDWEGLTVNDIATSQGYIPTIGDEWTMTFEVSIMPPLVKLLVGFVPLIFVGGILLFMLNKRKKEE